MNTGRTPLLRTALIGGVAYTAGQHANSRAAKHHWTDARQQQSANQPPAPAQVLPSGEEPGAIEQLKLLGALRDSKVLTEAEFETVKKKILDDL